MLRIVIVIICFIITACSATNDFDKNRAADARLKLVMAYLAEDELLLAYKNLKKASEYAPRDSQIQLGMALYEQKVGENQAARKRYQKLINDHKSSEILNHYGLFLCSLGEYTAAQQQYDNAISLSDVLSITETLKNSGYCALQAGNRNLAEVSLTKMIKQNPATSRELLSMADKFLLTKESSKALQLINIYEQNMDVDATSLWLRFRLAIIEKRQDDINYYREQLAQNFPLSEEYKQLLANEYRE